MPTFVFVWEIRAAARVAWKETRVEVPERPLSGGAVLFRSESEFELASCLTFASLSPVRYRTWVRQDVEAAQMTMIL
jgi:hypothetical protein